MSNILQYIGLFLLLCIPSMAAYADNNQTLNIYIWYGEIPDHVIAQFEKETGIHVNYATYGDNETLYAKLRATKNPGYDIVQPSSYYVQRMSREGMLEVLDKSQLFNYKNLDSQFTHPDYDPNGKYSLPYLWGITGIFVNKKYHNPALIKGWNDFWSPQYRNQIMLLNDPREVFSMALISLGYSANDSDPKHIEQAYLKLKALLPNIKIFNSDAIPSIFIDEDATIGQTWNGDIYRAHLQNSNLQFIFPKEGFVIWVDALAIPRGAPHLANAYKFLNFMMRGDIASQATLEYGYSTANIAARAFLPANIRNNKTIFPDATTLKRGQFQTDVGDNALATYAKYWELLKLSN